MDLQARMARARAACVRKAGEKIEKGCMLHISIIIFEDENSSDSVFRDYHVRPSKNKRGKVIVLKV